MESLGQHGVARHVIAHVSDPQLGAAPLVYRHVDGDATLTKVMDQVVRCRPDAIVLTGDITDTGDLGAYERVASIVNDAADSISAEVVWVMGNHDSRVPFAKRLLGQESHPDRPLDFVTWIGDLRIIALDTTVPGYHDGQLTTEQLEWLAAELSTPAPHGSVLAMHHPPTPTHIPLMALIELADQHLLADVVRGSDVRTILAGHYHYSLHTTLAGIPVSVAPSTCYGVDAGFDPRGLRGVDDLRGFDLVHVYDDQVVHSTVHVPNGEALETTGYPVEALDFVLAIPEEQHRDIFAKAGGVSDAAAEGLLPPEASNLDS